jgi:uncharacterized C2H2 Zn-finger protein
MGNCKDCDKEIKDGFYRCFKCNQVFKKRKSEEIEQKAQPKDYKFGHAPQEIRVEN